MNSAMQQLLVVISYYTRDDITTTIKVHNYNDSKSQNLTYKCWLAVFISLILILVAGYMSITTDTNTSTMSLSKGDMMWLKRSSHIKQDAVSRMLSISLRLLL